MFLYKLIRNVSIFRFLSSFKDDVMRINVGTPDRIVRLLIGAALVLLPFVSSLGLFATPAWQWGSVAVGVVLIVTAIIRFCPLYAILHLSTCKVPHP
jgi:Protein of unknown function (DUF2892)